MGADEHELLADAADVRALDGGACAPGVRHGPDGAATSSAVSPGNVEKVRTAPVVAIVAYDTAFYEQLPKLFPHRPNAGELFRDQPALAAETCFRNSSLQGGYFILAARMLGLDCGPLSGFDAGRVDSLFFEGTSLRANVLCCLGYGDPAGLFPRSPRLEFDEACVIV